MNLRPHEAIDSAAFGTEVMLHDRRNNLTHELNSSAAAVWLMLDGHRTLDQIVTELADRFRVLRNEVEVGVTEVVSQLEALGVLDGSIEPDVAPAIELRPFAESYGGQRVMARPPDP